LAEGRRSAGDKRWGPSVGDGPSCFKTAGALLGYVPILRPSRFLLALRALAVDDSFAVDDIGDGLGNVGGVVGNALYLDRDNKER